VFIEHFDDAGEIGKGSCQAIDLVHQHQVDLASADVGWQALQRRPFEAATGEAAIIVLGGEQDPTFMALAGRIGLTGC
jgi:hypothetical protein